MGPPASKEEYIVWKFLWKTSSRNEYVANNGIAAQTATAIQPRNSSRCARSLADRNHRQNQPQVVAEAPLMTFSINCYPSQYFVAQFFTNRLHWKMH